MLLSRPSGDLFGWSQDAGMGWDPAQLGGKEFLILSTHGGIRAADGTPIALGYHTGHWEVGLLMEAAAEELKSPRRHSLRRLLHRPLRWPHPGHHRACSTACPIATTPPSSSGRLIRSLPTRSGVIGVATCDKGLPAMMMALAGHARPACVLVPGGVTLLAEDGEDAGKVQTIGARFAHGQITLAGSRRSLCRACASPGRRLPVPRHCRHLAGRRRSARACRCRTPRSRRPASPSGSTWRAARRARRSTLERAA